MEYTLGGKKVSNHHNGSDHQSHKNHHHSSHHDSHKNEDHGSHGGHEDHGSHGGHGDHGSHGGHGDHGGHEGHDHGDMIVEFRNKFFIILVVTIPIMLLSPMIQSFMGVDWRFPGDLYIVAVLSTFVYFYGGWPFLKGAVDELKAKEPGMMTLIGTAISIAFFYSIAVVFGFNGEQIFGNWRHWFSLCFLAIGLKCDQSTMHQRHWSRWLHSCQTRPIESKKIAMKLKK